MQKMTFSHFLGPVAQLARAPALHAGGQEFDSPRVHHYICLPQFTLPFLSGNRHHDEGAFIRIAVDRCSGCALPRRTRTLPIEAALSFGPP